MKHRRADHRRRPGAVLVLVCCLLNESCGIAQVSVTHRLKNDEVDDLVIKRFAVGPRAERIAKPSIHSSLRPGLPRSIRIDEDEVRARDVSALADFAHPWVRHRLGAAPPSSNVGRGTIPPRCQWLTFFTNREKAVQTPADVACTDDEENYDGHHYKLLSVLAASHRDQLIVDVGTGYGLSALALSVEPSNVVVSIDKVDLVTRAHHFAKVNSSMFRRAVPNVSFHKLDAAQPATPQLMQYEGLLLAAALIVIDLDHLGNAESELYALLSAKEFGGIVVLSGIYHNSAMRLLWDSVTHRKFDVSHMGWDCVYCGTGVIDFAGRLVVNPKAPLPTPRPSAVAMLNVDDDVCRAHRSWWNKRATPVKVYDCFTFHFELELLSARLYELNDVVDYFILVEGNEAFGNQGGSKPLYYDINKERFADFHSKIIHVVVDDFRKGADGWEREQFQRNACLRGLNRTGIEAKDEDIVVIEDADELVKPAVLKVIKHCEGYDMHLGTFARMFQSTLYHETILEWSGSAIVPKMILGDEPHHVLNPRHARAMSQNGSFSEVFTSAAWHFSSFGSSKSFRLKLKTHPHEEYNNDYFVDDKTLIGRALRGVSYKVYRPAAVPMKVSRADDMPVYMRRRLEQFEFITEDDPYNPEVITEAEAPQVAQYEYQQGGIVELRPWMQQLVAFMLDPEDGAVLPYRPGEALVLPFQIQKPWVGQVELVVDVMNWQNRVHTDISVETQLDPSGAFGVFAITGLPCGVHTANLRAQRAKGSPENMVLPQYGDSYPHTHSISFRIVGNDCKLQHG